MCGALVLALLYELVQALLGGFQNVEAVMSLYRKQKEDSKLKVS